MLSRSACISSKFSWFSKTASLLLLVILAKHCRNGHDDGNDCGVVYREELGDGVDLVSWLAVFQDVEFLNVVPQKY